MRQNAESKDEHEVNFLRKVAQSSVSDHIGGEKEILMRELLSLLWGVSSDTGDSIIDLMNEIVKILGSRSTNNDNYEEEVFLMRKILVLFWGNTDVANEKRISGDLGLCMPPLE